MRDSDFREYRHVLERSRLEPYLVIFLIGACVQDNDVTELVVKDAGHHQMLVLSDSCVWHSADSRTDCSWSNFVY
eukprot:jgi/Botrbrau1/4680/Bobra.0218s0002.1